MKKLKRILILSVFLFLSVIVFSFADKQEWLKAGTAPNSYSMEPISENGKQLNDAYTLKAIDTVKTGFGTVMTYMDPTPYLGKRVRMAGSLKIQDVTNWAGFWMRIDEKDSKFSLGFDNMKNGRKDRSVKGTIDWMKYEIILDVPKESYRIAYGALLTGQGQIWFKDIQFQIVDKTVKITGW
jgi:hypothetical protein